MAAELSAASNVETLLSQHNAKDLLRFITCGNVDDGKSTLIGRLLLESGAIYDDQVEALQRESSRHGAVGGRIDTALLLDGLEDERRQGITIDVAYRYFMTPTRKFIIADTPGHEQFTRNMATGASTADLAVILVDSTKGISTQTRRHAFIVSLLGIKHVILAINKMDLVGYEESVFSQICREFGQLTRALSITDVCAIPLSALEGDNVVRSSERTSWYDGPTLLEQLIAVQVEPRGQSKDLRFPIQWVNRPDASFRGFSGTVASGKLCVGDTVLVLPSRNKARVASLVTMDGELDQASAPDAVTVTLDSEIDVTRGDMLVTPEAPPSVVRNTDATLVWMSVQPLVPGKHYWFKHTTRRTTCEVEAVRYRTDVNTLERAAAPSLALNEIGRCRLQLHEPMMLDTYNQNRETGSFILVDRITHETVAAGMVAETANAPEVEGQWGDASAMVAAQPARSLITEQERSLRYWQRPLTILITGLSGSGKTSVAMELEQRLFQAGRTCVVLDGQSLRLGLCRDLGYSAEARSENLRRAAEIARIINDAGQICIAAFVAPSRWVRQKVRARIGSERILHVHLCTPPAVCRRRDISGQYRAADRGEIANFPGVTSEYEVPDDADLSFDTTSLSARQVVEAILQEVDDRLRM